VRKASGLVKAGSPFRVFAMTVTNQGLGAFMATFFLYGVGAFPRSNMLLALVLCGVFLTVFNVAYGLLAATYPRSGGEYVFLSRILHPVVGFVSNFGAYIAFCFFSATGGYLAFTLALSPALQALGVITDHSWITSVGTWLGDNDHAWLCGSILLVLAAILVSFGTSVYYRFQSVVWWVGWIGFGTMILVLLLTSRDTFIRGFNDYVATTGGGSDGYARTLAAAKENGLPTGYALKDTLGMFAVATSVSAAGAYMGGEVRTPLRTQIIGGGGGGLFFSLIVIVLGLLVSKTVGLDFNRAATYLAVQHPDEFVADQSPVFTWFAFLCTSSPVILVVMCVGIVLFTAILVPQQIMYPTRMLFAWSFDRMVPGWMSDVSPKSGVPVKATIVVLLTCEALLALYGSGQITFINPILIVGVVWGIIALAAILFPFMPRSRDTFESSRINHRVLGVPLISVAGVVGLIFFAVGQWIAYTSDTLGANQGSNVRIALTVFAFAIVYYVATRAFRARQGVNMNATFAELPPD
jgi:amino acid transporter